MNLKRFIFLIVFLSFLSCKQNAEVTEEKIFEAPIGMVFINTKSFLQGAKPNDNLAMPREKPAHEVSIDGFFIDITEVTNAQFKDFVQSTNYITVAERQIKWEDLKKDLPQGTPKPHDSLLQPGSLIFNKAVATEVNMQNCAQWWTWKIGANWKHPQGPDSTIDGQDNFPVIHVAYQDVIAYCKWKNRRLPTESEWESAAQGNLKNPIFTWGNDAQLLNEKANTWQGTFPTKNNPIDGFSYVSPVKSYDPNSIGLYDMSGNVWEITSDFFNTNYYKTLDNNKTIINPTGSKKSYTSANSYTTEYVIKGGSFLCNASYCASFRISARMGMSPDSGSDHIGFRTVLDVDMLSSKK